MQIVQSVVTWFATTWFDWELLLRFLDVLVWPLVVVVGLTMVRPGRLIDYILENGGELAAAGATIRLGNRVEQITQAVEQDEVTATEPEVAIINPLQEAADPYTTIMNGWGKVIEGLEIAFERVGLGKLDKRNPMDAVLTLRRQDLIGRKLEQNIQALWEFRNRVTRAGSHRLERLGLNQLGADEYYSTADRVRRGIIRALDYRESRGMIPVVLAAQSELPAGAPLN